VCSGAGGMDLGFHRAGCRTVAMCEVDPWRRRLLAARFPGVPIFPDLTTLDPTELPRADILIGGTPCTDLSVAGRRAGLDGESSRLFWDYCRVRNATGVEWCVWENVAGALSSNAGLDFASVLGAFVGADVPVPAAGWGGAGVVAGPWGGACWRTLDAQHFGVPQRRRRVFVVGHLGGECPPEVLLEPASGRRDSASRRGARAGVARVVAPLTAQPGFTGPGSDAEGAAGGHLVVNALDRQSGGPDDNSAQAGHIIPLVPVGVPLDAGPGQRGRGAGDGSQVDGERSPDGFDGAPVDADGVRETDELAGRVDGPAVTAFDWQAGDPASDRDDAGRGRKWIARAGDYTGALGVTRRDGVAATGLVEGDRCAYDPQPDGRRYAACGDGVVANVAEWIARRLLAVASAKLEQAA
jgi:site-specific DNA-cytosine methylase